MDGPSTGPFRPLRFVSSDTNLSPMTPAGSRLPTVSVVPGTPPVVIAGVRFYALRSFTLCPCPGTRCLYLSSSPLPDVRPDRLVVPTLSRFLSESSSSLIWTPSSLSLPGRRPVGASGR